MKRLRNSVTYQVGGFICPHCNHYIDHEDSVPTKCPKCGNLLIKEDNSNEENNNRNN